MIDIGMLKRRMGIPIIDIARTPLTRINWLTPSIIAHTVMTTLSLGGAIAASLAIAGRILL
jgi:hypothetical protein